MTETKFDELKDVVDKTEKLNEKIQGAAKRIINCYNTGSKLLACGNGGSATQAEHLVAELVGRYLKDRAPLEAVSLCSNTASLTAISNDYGYDEVFARQVDALGKKGDVLVLLSTSGNSENMLKAIDAAKKNNLTTISILGKNGGKMKGKCDIEIIVPSEITPRIQEMHLFIIHELCEAIEGSLFPKR